jgi:hypothetical protein
MTRLGWIGSPSPDQQLWVVWNSRVVVLGDFALLFDPQDRIFASGDCDRYAAFSYRWGRSWEIGIEKPLLNKE